MRFPVTLIPGLLIVASLAHADDTFDKLLRARKFREAIEYADQNIAPPSRNADTWTKIAEANEQLGLAEKALACYLVSARSNPKDYASWLGAARIYNKLGQHDNALEMSKRALDLNFAAEASWEYANACIKLNRSADAKKALEKVMESDPQNVVANRELGNIYFDDKEYSKAVPLLKRSYEKKADADVAYKLGKAALETNDLPLAVEHLKNVLKQNANHNEAGLELARTYYKLSDFSNAAAQYDKSITRGPATATDHFQHALAKEKMGDGKGAVAAYERAISEFGASRGKEALHARLIVGKAKLAAKDYRSALGHFKFISTGEKSEIPSDLYFLLADGHEGAGEISDAIGNLEKAISLDSKNVEAYARLADLYKKNKMEDKARQTYEKMLNLSPNDPNVYLVLGQYNLKIKNYPKALELFSKSQDLKKSSTASEGMALAAAEQNRWEIAKDAAITAVRMDPEVVQSRIVLAKAYMKDGDFKNAVEPLEFLLRKEPSNIGYWQDVATCYGKIGSADKLAKADEKIINLDRANTESRYRFAEFALSRKDSKAAQTVYRELAALAPKDPFVFKSLYQIGKDLGDKNSALDNVQKYLALSSKDADAQKDMGDFLYEKKDLDGALNAYREALKIDPNIKGFYKRYAEIVIAKGQHDEAIRALTGKIRSGEATGDDYTTLGMIYQKKGSHKSAVESYQKALQMDPQNVDVLTALAESQAALGMDNEAIITYEQVIMMGSSSGKEHKALGDLYARQGKTEQSMKVYKSYLDKVPSDSKVALMVGNYFLQQKQYPDAAKYLEMIKGADAESFEVQMAIGQSHFYAKNYKKAIEIFENLRRKGSKSAGMSDVLRVLAEAYEKENQPAKAAEVYGAYAAMPGAKDPDASYKSAFLLEKSNPASARRIYEENTGKYPRDFRNFLQLGLMYSEDKANLSKAISMFNRITVMADSIPLIYMKLAEIYGKMGKDDDELRAYESYIKADPQNPEANKRIGVILVKKGRYKEGLIYLETSSTLAPNDLDILLALAQAYMKTNRPQEAVSSFTKAKAIKKADLEIRNNLYQLHTKLGNTKEARKEIEELITLNPNDNGVKLIHAQMLYDDAKYREAEEQVENVMSSAPSSDALMLRGRIRTAKKDYQGALDTYEEIIGMENSAPALYEKAELFRVYSKELGKSPKWAETFYERALRADPSYALAELGLARLYKLWKRDDLYARHLESAKKLDPNNKEIQEEAKRSKK